MKSQFLTFIVGAIGGIALAWGLSRHPVREEAHEGEAESRHHSERPGLKWSEELRESMGLEVLPIGTTNAPVLQLVRATVVDVTSLVQLADEISVARIQAEASEVEFRRLKVLYEQGQTASARAFEAGELGMKRDRMAVVMAERKLRLLLGTEFFDRSDLTSIVDGLAHRRASLIRLQIPVGAGASGTPRSAWVRSLDSLEPPVPIRVLGRAAVQENMAEAGAFWAIREDARLASGGALEAWIESGNSTVSGLFVPPSAILRHEGSTSIYVVKEEGKLERVRIRLETRLLNGWIVSGGVTNGNQVVITGAQQLLSSELKPTGGEE